MFFCIQFSVNELQSFTFQTSIAFYIKVTYGTSLVDRNKLITAHNLSNF